MCLSWSYMFWFSVFTYIVAQNGFKSLRIVCIEVDVWAQSSRVHMFRSLFTSNPTLTYCPHCACALLPSFSLCTIISHFDTLGIMWSGLVVWMWVCIHARVKCPNRAPLSRQDSIVRLYCPAMDTAVPQSWPRLSNYTKSLCFFF